MREKDFQSQHGTVHYWVSEEPPESSEQPAGAAASPQLVFLPGLTADHRLFDKQVEYFEPRARCLVWDPPAHAASRPYASFDMRDWARDLRAILREEGFDRPILVGQSMGGYVSQMFMELFPGEVRGFVSVDSCPLQRSYYAGWELWALKHTYVMYLSIPWKLLVRWGSNGTADSPYGRALMREMMTSYTKREYCELTAKGYRTLAEAVELDRVYKIDCPALLLCGENDAAGSAKRYVKAWTANTGLPLVWVRDAGHNANTDQPEFINEQIEFFASSLR